MLPNVGDVYSVFSSELQQYVACQVTRIKDASSSRPVAAVLELDWTGDALPDAAAVQAMRPLLCDYFFWNNRHDHCYATANVPPGHTLVGNIAPLVDVEVNSYRSGWNVGDSVLRQRNWERIDPLRRQQFKAASDEREVTVGGQVLRQDATKIDDSVLQALGDISELEQLPCLMSIETSNGTQALMEFIQGNPFINELHWQSSTVHALDFSGSGLSRLILQPDGVTSVVLNKGLSLLALRGAPSPALRIDDGADGRHLTLQCTQTLPPFHGLGQLGGLSLVSMKEVDLAQVAQRFPHLTALRIWGKPGLASQMDSLAQLTALRMFTAYDLFGYTAEEFPSATQLPQLSALWLTSLPADVAKAIKTGYKRAAALGLDLSVTKARKPEWLADNLLNPFRDWDGREHISPAYAKKAALAYKNMLAVTRGIDVAMEATAATAALETMVAAYVDVFNKIERRASIIETVEREEIYTVLAELLVQLRQQLGGQGAALVDEAALLDLFDRLREF
ncbi:hypothetical protein SAMN03097694_3183 [Janthinobacterium lividum]|uniref:Adventurous gliding motility protein n=1 Tax=Janthinobacterium lividum TaxID=29581 RepID=A0AB38C9Q4_9BURK|nr:hypothetical protein [Janthinobacterium lividum]SFX77604.1 hypothetical protein SAMN03097694_3183 [Janthinobacterium lividum]